MTTIFLNEATEELFANMAEPTEAEKISAIYEQYGVKEFPWTAEGYNIFSLGTYAKEQGNAVYDPNHEYRAISPKQSISDFYLLDAMASGVLSTHLHNGPKKMSYNWQLLNAMFDAGLASKRGNEKSALNKVMEQALQKFTSLVVTQAPAFKAYSRFAIVSELRYSHNIRYILQTKQKSFWSAWNTLTEKVGGDKTARWAAELFRNKKYGSWTSSYGGEPWAVACDVLEMYESGNCNGMRFTEREFLDRVFSLEHNTGTFLNKWEWAGSISSLSDLLEAHNESDWVTLSRYGSRDVKILWGRYLYLSGVSSSYLISYGKRVNQGYNLMAQRDKKVIKSPPISKKFLEILEPTSNKLPNVKEMTSVYVGKCKTSGKTIDKGDEIVWHGKNMGASLLTEWNNQ